MKGEWKVSGKIKAVCISEKRGTPKINIGAGNLIENFGLEKDAHGGNWHRQISFLSFESVEEFRQRGAEVADGAFGENILVEGIDLKNLPIGSRLHCNKAVLEITMIGKTCHNPCEIYRRMGECIMPVEGVFAIVLHGGHIKLGDEIYVEE